MPVSPARAAAFDILLRVEQHSAYASELLHSKRLETLSVVDRGLATELVMGVLRWRSRLDEMIGLAAARPVSKLDIEVLTALRLAAYQVAFLSRIPPRAAINESVELVKRAKKRSAAPFANAVLRRLAEENPESSAEGSSLSSTDLARDHAHPEWLVQRWVEQFGISNAQRICEHDQRLPAAALRFDTPDVEAELAREGVTFAPGALLTTARVMVAGDVTHTAAFREGRVFIQDEASQLVAALVGKGTRMLDCCAAPGSKTAAIAARNPAAEIIAAELHAHRAELLRQRVQARNVKVLNADVLDLSLDGGFDSALRRGFSRHGSFDPMGVWATQGRILAPPFIVSMSASDYPSARLRPRSARFRFARQDHCSSANDLPFLNLRVAVIRLLKDHFTLASRSLCLVHEDRLQLRSCPRILPSLLG
jgi:16S rRNA (cytosine967-C5)-methyltransferase